MSSRVCRLLTKLLQKGPNKQAALDAINDAVADIDGKLNAQKAAVENERKLKALFDAMSDLDLSFDKDDAAASAVAAASAIEAARAAIAAKQTVVAPAQVLGEPAPAGGESPALCTGTEGYSRDVQTRWWLTTRRRRLAQPPLSKLRH